MNVSLDYTSLSLVVLFLFLSFIVAAAPHTTLQQTPHLISSTP